MAIFNALTIYANINDNITTTYHKGVFHTNKHIVANADFNKCSLIIDSLLHDFQTDPKHLFTWALKNTGQTHKKDGSDDVVMLINRMTYDPDSAKSMLNVDFVTSGGITFRNKNLLSYVHDTEDKGRRLITVDFYYSGSLLKKAYGEFILQELNPQQTYIDISIDIQFGWFFNLFVTQRRYRSVFEWRIGQFIENLKEYCEM